MSQLSDNIDSIQRRASGETYKQIVLSLEGKEGIIVNHDEIQKRDSMIGRPDMKAITWPASTSPAIAGLISYHGIELSVTCVSPEYACFRFPILRFLVTPTWNRFLRSKVANYPRLPHGAIGDWILNPVEKRWVAGNGEPTADNMGPDIHYWIRTRIKCNSVNWDMVDSSADQFMELLARQYKAYDKQLKVGLTEDAAKARILAKYKKDILEPARAWYKRMPEQRKKLFPNFI